MTPPHCLSLNLCWPQFEFGHKKKTVTSLLWTRLDGLMVEICSLSVTSCRQSLIPMTQECFYMAANNKMPSCLVTSHPTVGEKGQRPCQRGWVYLREWGMIVSRTYSPAVNKEAGVWKVKKTASRWFISVLWVRIVINACTLPIFIYLFIFCLQARYSRVAGTSWNSNAWSGQLVQVSRSALKVIRDWDRWL